MKIGVIVIARSNSSRLPGKVLRTLHGQPVLGYIFERLKYVVDSADIVVATSNESQDDLIEFYCQQQGIKTFRGSLTNVAERFLGAAKAHNYDYAVRINGDNLFVDVSALKAMMSLTSRGYEFISNVKNRTFPRGMSIEIVKTDSYAAHFPFFQSADYLEHVTKYFYDHEDKLSSFHYENHECPEAANLQLAIDTEYDFRLAEKILARFEKRHTEYTLRELYRVYLQSKQHLHFTGQFGPLLIAEIGGNHEGDFEYAKELTRLAIESDSDFVKYQVYTGDTLVNPLLSPDRHKHFKKFELTKDQYIELAMMVEGAGKRFMASIWHASMLEWLAPHMSIYKIGSGDFMAWSLIKDIAAYNAPMILSTGLATEADVVATVNFLRSVNNLYEGSNFLAVLQCTSMYPIPYADANLATLPRLKELTKATVGYSDHTEGLEALTYATCMGAQVLEYHFTDAREGKVFRDHKVSLTKGEVHTLIKTIKTITTLSGNSFKEPTLIEKATGHVSSFRRGVFLNRDVNPGEMITEKDITMLRPDVGISSQYYASVINKKARIHIKKFEPLSWELLE